MDGQTVWDIVKTLVGWAWIPIGAYLGYRNIINNRDFSWKEDMEKRLSISEANDKLHELQIQTIKESLSNVAKETKEAIKEVKQGVDKLIDKLIK